MKFNKIMASLAAVACTASIFSVMSVSAADDFTIAVGSAEAKTGDKFTIEVKLENVPSTGIAGLDFAIKYDSAAIKVNSVTEGAASKTNDKQPDGISSNLETNIGTGEVSVLWATGQIKTSDSWIKKDGVLLTLDCTAVKLDDGKSSAIEIVPVTRKEASIDAVGSGMKVFKPAVSAGKVSAKAAETEAPKATEKVTTAEKTDKINYGDVDGNGTVELTDLTALSLYLLGDKDLKGDNLKAADVNGNGDVDLADLAHLKQYISEEEGIVLGPKKK